MAVSELTLEESRPPVARRFKLPNRRSWKRIEREVARWLGAEVAERVPVSGRIRGWAPDIEHPWLALEVKSFAALPPRVREAIDQAVKAAEWMKQKRGEDKLPVGILHLSHLAIPYGCPTRRGRVQCRRSASGPCSRSPAR